VPEPVYNGPLTQDGGNALIQDKIERLAQGGRRRVLDLFSGCGGLSLGFHRAGFEVAAAVESDPLAARSHGLNFHPASEAHSKHRDITSLTPAELADELDLGPVPDAIDVIVGGPPCQAFSRVGRPKLREIAEHPRAFKHDPRANLYLHYLEYVEAFQPLALLLENVPDVLNHGGQNIAEDICEVLEDKGYVARYTLLNSAFYGVPQMRERMFLMAYRRELDIDVAFPNPTHWLDLPVGYNGSRHVALRLMRNDLFGGGWRYVAPPKATAKLKAAVSVEQAINDLPPITLHLEGKLTRGARRFDEAIPYGKARLSAYAQEMRTWPGFEAKDGLLDHVIRYLPRDWKLFARMNPGDQYPEAHAHAEKMFREHLRKLARKGEAPAEGTKAYKRLEAEFVPPYDAGKFPNKWRKMWPDQPARTLMAHLGKDTYSHIHYDRDQARTISVREAARLQSFPDGFIFCGTMNPAFRQIGNAVPPLMARALAASMSAALAVAAVDSEPVAVAR
jgi:DNA (cytosine-5)-methyltransferase 1